MCGLATISVSVLVRVTDKPSCSTQSAKKLKASNTSWWLSSADCCSFLMLSGFSDLLKKIDPEFHDASHELLDELGVKPEDIDPVILVSKSTIK